MDVRNKWNLFESLKKVYLDNDLQYECLASNGANKKNR